MKNLPKKLQDKKDWALGQNDFGGPSNKIVALVLTASRNSFRVMSSNPGNKCIMFDLNRPLLEIWTPNRFREMQCKSYKISISFQLKVSHKMCIPSLPIEHGWTPSQAVKKTD